MTSQSMPSEISRETKTYVCTHVFDRIRPVLYVTRPDGDWCVLCGDQHPNDASAYRVVGMGHVVNYDPSVTELFDLRPNQEAEREAVGDPWVRADF